MSEWKEYTIEELAEKVGMGPFGSNIKVSTFVSSGIPVISGEHLHELRMRDGEFNFITEEHAKRLLSSNVFRGDVIFTHAGNIGQVSVIPNNSLFERYVISQRQFFLRCDRNKLEPEFIAYYFKSREGQYKLLANANQTGVPSLAQPVSYLKSIKILLPPLPEQRAIVSVLSSLDDKIDLLHRQNKTLEALAETLFRQWFVEEAEEGKRGKLGDVIELAYGRGLKEEIRTGAGFPVVGSSGVVGYHSEFMVEGPGIVIGRKGTLGKVLYLFENFFPIDTTYYVKPRVDSTGLFYEYFLLKTLSFEDLNSDSAVPGLNRDIALAADIRIPPAEKMKEFNNFCKPLFQKVNQNNNQIRSLTQLRDTLLPKLMSREVRVKV